MEFTVKSPKTGTKDEGGKTTPREVNVSYDFGKDLDEAVRLFTPEVVFSKFLSQASTDLGNNVRRILNEPENGEAEVSAFVEKWKPGVVTKGPGRKKAPTPAELVAELKHPDITQERKVEIKNTLQKMMEDARAALKVAAS